MFIAFNLFISFVSCVAVSSLVILVFIVFVAWLVVVVFVYGLVIVESIVLVVGDSSNVYVVCIVEFDSSNVDYLVVLVSCVCNVCIYV